LQALKDIKRPALTYYGGKWRLAPWIISHFPPHDHYVELCGGAGSVLIQKPRSKLETYNDIDGNVVNFFRVLRENTDELIRQIKLTPWARAEFELSLELTEDKIEAARRFFVCMGLGVKNSLRTTKGQFRLKVNEEASGVIPVLYHSEIEKIANRFNQVQIEQMNYDYMIKKCDNEDTLFYFDPPYVVSKRTHDKVYMIEFTNEDHIKAAILLKQIKGYAIVSGYACNLYTELYENYDWQRKDRESNTNSGGKRIESIWLCPRTSEALKPKSKTMRYIEDLMR